MEFEPMTLQQVLDYIDSWQFSSEEEKDNAKSDFKKMALQHFANRRLDEPSEHVRECHPHVDVGSTP